MNEIMTNPMVLLTDVSSPEEAKNNLSTYSFELGQAIEKGNAAEMWSNFMVLKEACRMLGQPIMPFNAWTAIGLTQEEASGILQGKLYQNDPDVVDTVKKIKTYVLADMEQGVLNGKINPSILTGSG